MHARQEITLLSDRIRMYLSLIIQGMLLFTGCETSEADATSAAAITVDHTNPASVVEAIFQAAKTGDASLLQGICDPSGNAHLDVRRICDYANGFDKEGEFPMFFAEGRLNGDAYISGETAKVPFLFGPDGDKPDTMDLVKRDGKWYIERF